MKIDATRSEMAEVGPVLILAPLGRDTLNIVRLLTQRGLVCDICNDLEHLVARADEQAGAILITEEALLHGDLAPLAEALEAQPAWSDFPFVFLYSRRRDEVSPPSRRAGRLPPRATNVMLLERPLGSESLLSAIDWALGSRKRQFLIRDQIAVLNAQALLLQQNERALEESRSYLRDVLDSAQEGFYAIDPDGRTTVCNAAFRRILGFSGEAEIVGLRLHDIIHHSHKDGSVYPSETCPIYNTAQTGVPCHVIDEFFYRQDGVAVPVEYRAQPVYRQGNLMGAVCTFSDRTESLKAEDALRSANERFSLVLSSGAIVGSWVWEVQADRFTADERFAQTFMLDPERLATCMNQAEIMQAIHPEDQAHVRTLTERALTRGGAFRAEYRVRRQDGSWRWIEASGNLSLDEGGRPGRFPGVLIDISERKRIEEALRESDNDLRTIADSLPFLIAYIDKDLVFRFANRAYEDWFGLQPSDVIGRHARDIIGSEGFAARKGAIDRVLAGETLTLQIPWMRHDGRRCEAELRYMPRIGSDGAVLGYHVFVIDVTERVEAAEALKDAAEALEQRVIERTAALTAEIAERQKAEEALRQSQKMEAVGQLTGGIAHDFNNMLTGIMGSIDLMKRRIESGRFTGLERFMEAASASAHRAASLTHRLLAFSRRQSLDARPIDVNVLVASLEDLLSRTIGEQVALRVRLADRLPLARADSNQLENALLNLAINARDAMPDGGDLMIETSDFEQELDGHGAEVLAAGRYVMLSVTDTGTGMSPDVLARAFEPFYTTKPLGQGTGLGLSMIYGFARQSGGSVRIKSSPDAGTVVQLCLPVAAASDTQMVLPEAAFTEAAFPEEADEPGKSPVPPLRGAGETVLVVEDDPAVRLLVLEVLNELGYAAIEAEDAQMALPLLGSPQRIDLLVTDVGLPGLNGRQLAEIARQTRPDLPILFMTGYAAGATTRSGFLGEGMQMITKPFKLQSLAARIRGMLVS